MTKENLEELRERLIRDERVRQMIRVRAYEIFQMRGSHPGNQTQDWFQAEHEVLAFLIAEDPQKTDEGETPPAQVSTQTSGRQEAPPPIAAKPRSSASKMATSKSAPSKRASSKKTVTARPKSKRARKKPTPNTAD